MTVRKALFLSGNYFNSPIQVGDQHFARYFARSGWQVAYLSTPISPLHLIKGLTGDLKDRFQNYIQHGQIFPYGEGYVWSYVPAALLVPQNRPLLRSRFFYDHWHRLTLPNLVKVVRSNGFDQVDLIYIRDPRHGFWRKLIPHHVSIYRIADQDAGFAHYNRQVQQLENELASSVNMVVYTANRLKSYVDNLKPRKSAYLPNGVDFAHFANGNGSIPTDLQAIRRPIVIYAGTMEYWLDAALVNKLTELLPEVSFVFIGPNEAIRDKLLQRENLILLGRKSYANLPAYLHHADIGVIPFNVRDYPTLVNAINPLKLYEYMACGLPVVATEWEELKMMDTPAHLCKTPEDFRDAILRILSQKEDRQTLVNFAEKQDWSNRFRCLEAYLIDMIGETR